VGPQEGRVVGPQAPRQELGRRVGRSQVRTVLPRPLKAALDVLTPRLARRDVYTDPLDDKRKADASPSQA